MRIGIDARYLSHGLIGGVHNYLAHLVPALLDTGRAHQFFLYVDDKRPFELTDLPGHATLRTLPYRGPLSSARFDLTLHRAMRRDAVDVMHFPANIGLGARDIATVLTLHDAINVMPLRDILAGHRKAPRTAAMMTYLHAMTKAAVRRADVLATGSQHARAAILTATRLDPDRVAVVPLAAPPRFGVLEDRPAFERVRARLQLPDRFILADALKNPAVVVAAHAGLPVDLRTQTPIVFFCRHDRPPTPVTDAVMRGVATLVVRPSDDELLAVYNLARAFVFPSLIEGFGIVALEAMACGVPVVASDRGSIPEVCGDAALLAPADDVSAFARHLEAALRDGPERARLIAAGFEQARRFSWRRSALLMLDLYAQAVARRAARHPAPAAEVTRCA